MDFIESVRTRARARVRRAAVGVLGAVTYTTLVGQESLKRRTANATRMMRNKSFHSPEVMSNPPGEIDLRERPLEAAALLASASRWGSLKFLYFEAVGSGEGGGGEGGRRARTLAAMKK